MKTHRLHARPIALAAAALFLSASALAQDTVEVLHWWTTGGTAAAAAKLKEAAQAAGVSWKDVAVAGNENQRTLLRTKLMKGRATPPAWRRSWATSSSSPTSATSSLA